MDDMARPMGREWDRNGIEMGLEWIKWDSFQSDRLR